MFMKKIFGLITLFIFVLGSCVQMDYDTQLSYQQSDKVPIRSIEEVTYIVNNLMNCQESTHSRASYNIKNINPICRRQGRSAECDTICCQF